MSATGCLWPPGPYVECGVNLHDACQAKIAQFADLDSLLERHVDPYLFGFGSLWFLLTRIEPGCADGGFYLDLCLGFVVSDVLVTRPGSQP